MRSLSDTLLSKTVTILLTQQAPRPRNSTTFSKQPRSLRTRLLFSSRVRVILLCSGPSHFCADVRCPVLTELHKEVMENLRKQVANLENDKCVRTACLTLGRFQSLQEALPLTSFSLALSRVDLQVALRSSAPQQHRPLLGPCWTFALDLRHMPPSTCSLRTADAAGLHCNRTRARAPLTRPTAIRPLATLRRSAAGRTLSLRCDLSPPWLASRSLSISLFLPLHAPSDTRACISVPQVPE